MGQVIVNKPAQTVADIIHAIEDKAATPILEATLISIFPPLGMPVISTIFHAVFGYLMGKLGYLFQKAGIKITIKLQTEGQKTAYAEAEALLRAANLTGDPKKIEEATLEFEKRFQKLAHYDGDAKPTSFL